MKLKQLFTASTKEYFKPLRDKWFWAFIAVSIIYLLWFSWNDWDWIVNYGL